MSARRFLICAAIVLSFANVANAARYQRCRDGKTLVWNSQRGVAQEATWSGLRDVKGYATGEGTLTWYRLNDVVNSYTGKMVHGKLEGLVIKEQGQTRLQAKFADGEKVGGWSEPGAVEARTPTPTATSTPKPEPPTPVATARPQEAEILPTPIPFRSPSRSSTPRPTPIPTASPLPTPTATPTPSPTPTSTPTPNPTPRPTPTPSLTPVVTPTPTPRSTPIPSATSTSTPSQLKSLPSSPMPQPDAKTFRLEEVVDGAAHDSLVLSSPAPALRNTLEEGPPPETTAQSSASKDEMVADFKKRTESVFGQVREATEKFREVNRIDGMPALPESVAPNVRSLAKQATDLREQFGYQVEFYECGVETATVAGLVAVDQATLFLAQKNAPEARLRLTGFFSRYPTPTRENQKALWQYLGSMLIAANKARADAEIRLKRAKSFEAAGKKSEALREYREIYRIYPNPITADKIKLLEAR